MTDLLCWIQFQDFLKALKLMGYSESDEIFIGASAIAIALEGHLASYAQIYQMALGLCSLAHNEEQMYGIAAFAFSFWPHDLALPSDEIMLRALKGALEKRLIPERKLLACGV